MVSENSQLVIFIASGLCMFIGLVMICIMCYFSKNVPEEDTNPAEEYYNLSNLGTIEEDSDENTEESVMVYININQNRKEFSETEL